MIWEKFTKKENGSHINNQKMSLRIDWTFAFHWSDKKEEFFECYEDVSNCYEDEKCISIISNEKKTWVDPG